MVRPPVASIAWGVVLNAVVPVILYKLSKKYYSPSELTALVFAATFPLGKSAFDLMRRRQLDPISILVLLGIATDGVALSFGGSPRLLLVRESMFTGAFGVACFASLVLPRPMMFYFNRYFVAGTDPQRQATFNAAWKLREVRFCHRLITIVWGCVFVGELILRIFLIYLLPAAMVLVISSHPDRRLDHHDDAMGFQLRASRAAAGRGAAPPGRKSICFVVKSPPDSGRHQGCHSAQAPRSHVPTAHCQGKAIGLE